LISKASERTPEKIGKHTVGTGIPIVSEEEAREGRFDYMLTFLYGFTEELVARERDFLQGGGKLVCCLPEFRVMEGEVR
jgi:NDP-4-keto-2,6-dideoxyhexose 3-C-methyltransferase